MRTVGTSDLSLSIPHYLYRDFLIDHIGSEGGGGVMAITHAKFLQHMEALSQQTFSQTEMVHSFPGG